ncbi:hypothetical protein KM043_003073 [Ampulex compressa]|nr:hypothetical protein KM043_003073 [Ampulex compressa]
MSINVCLERCAVFKALEILVRIIVLSRHTVIVILKLKHYAQRDFVLCIFPKRSKHNGELATGSWQNDAIPFISSRGVSLFQSARQLRGVVENGKGQLSYTC